MNIKDIVKNTIAVFVEYRKGNLWYDVDYTSGGRDRKFLFPVPIEGIGDGLLPAEIKASSLIRYIRKHLKDIQA